MKPALACVLGPVKKRKQASTSGHLVEKTDWPLLCASCEGQCSDGPKGQLPGRGGL